MQPHQVKVNSLFELFKWLATFNEWRDHNVLANQIILKYHEFARDAPEVFMARSNEIYSIIQ
jgi:hypothetical protein